MGRTARCCLIKFKWAWRLVCVAVHMRYGISSITDACDAWLHLERPVWLRTIWEQRSVFGPPTNDMHNCTVPTIAVCMAMASMDDLLYLSQALSTLIRFALKTHIFLSVLSSVDTEAAFLWMKTKLFENSPKWINLRTVCSCCSVDCQTGGI